MDHFMRVATRKQDQFSSQQFHSLRPRLTDERVSFGHEMEHHGIARFHRESPRPSDARPYQHKAISADRLQPPVQCFHDFTIAE
jgi:hypothetical protein